jgi:predicted lipid-binding transport protein (Tim44 family)
VKRSIRQLTMAMFAAAVALGLGIAAVDAKPGRGGSAGSRGAKTDMSVPSTPTAPRTGTQQGAPNTATPGRPAAAAAAAQAAKPSMMSTMAKGFAMGLIGAGLFGLLTGSGLFGGLSGIMGFLGLLLQVALIALAVRLIWGFFRNRQQQAQPAVAAAGAMRSPLDRMGMNQPQGQQPQAAAQPVVQERRDTVGIGPDDYTGFQAALVGVMAAYSNEDLAGIRKVATPEMSAHYIRELHENQSKGVVNRIGVPELRQGDLAEAWYEDNTAYATVAMRFAMTDVMVERATGKTVSGNPQVAEESVEIWTFRRDGAGQPWMVSAVEQA